MFDPTNPIRDPKLQDLSQPAAVAAHLEYMKQSVLTGRTYEALLSSHFVRQWLQAHPEYLLNTDPLYEQLRVLLVDNSWIALSMLKDEAVVVELLNKHLLALFTLAERYTFNYPTDDLVQRLLLEGMRGYLLNYMLFEDRDRIKQHCNTALETSDTVVTSAPFYLEIKQVPATLKNWFSVYKVYMGSALASKDRRKKFLNISENGAPLNAIERQRLAVVFELYQRCRLSSLDPLGMEEEITYTDGDESGIFLYGEQFPHDKAMIKTIRELTGSDLSDNPVVTHTPVAAVAAKLNPNHIVSVIDNGPDVAATKGPDHFADQDVAEIERHTKELEKFGNSASQLNYAAVANDIKTELALVFTTPEDEKRFAELVASVLRGLRDTMELKQYLLDLAFPSADCDAVVAAVQAKLSPQAKRAGTKLVKDNLATKPTLQQLQKQLDQTAEPITTTPTLASTQAQVEVPAPASVDQTRKAFLPKLRRARAVKRPLLDDVRLQPSMVMGPIDELRAMDTLEYRRLSPDPVSAARRLKDRIELLGEESITKQAEGIEAFKQSPLNRLYLELGNESIASGQAVTMIIATRQAKGVPTLSEAEFNAISDLNKQLRF